MNNPTTFSTFEEVRNRWPGAGFILQKEADPYTCVELDKCREPETGRIDDWAREIMERFNAPTEPSPSGKGIHIWIRGEKPGLRCRGVYKSRDVEVYSAIRFVRLSGQWLSQAPTSIPDRQAELERFYLEVFPTSPPRPVRATLAPPIRDDQECLRRVTRGDLGRRLWAGDWRGYDSQSSADLALCNLLKECTNRDPDRIDRLFRQSGLYRDKWDRPDGTYGSYGARTIRTALCDG